MMAGRGTGTWAAGGPARHIPVMPHEVLEALKPRDGGGYVDGTFGAGGHSRALLEAADCVVLAIDRDPDAIAEGAALQDSYPDRMTLSQGSFADMERLAAEAGLDSADGVVLDLGVSSMQLDQSGRGFSFMREGPLDMRMSREGLSAADVVNTLPEAQIARILHRLGEERRSRAIARAIVAARREQPLQGTKELADLVARVVSHAGAKHPATRTFQALRLYVNGELEQLLLGLFAAERLLGVGGRLVVLTFHSLEDRIVKTFLANRAGQVSRSSRHLPDAGPEPGEPSFRILTRRPKEPSEAEINANPRARSARLRAGERTEAEAMTADAEALGLAELIALRA